MITMAKNKKVAIALSGGVDSSFCAYLLLNKGYEIEAFTLRIPYLPEDYIARASLLCGKLGISHHIIDAGKIFQESIIKYFVNSYLNGLTPNPCALCNRDIKFGLLFNEAKKFGFDLLATGHYARIEKKNEEFYIKKAHYENNSQEYFIALVPKSALSHCLLPLGEYTKEQAEKGMSKIYPFYVPPSREVCFVKSGDYRGFISASISDSSLYSGFIRHYDGKILGKHTGIYNYTYGQREGLGISWPVPLYVLDINYKTKDVIVAEKELILKGKFYVSNINWFYPASSYNNIFVRLRYNSRLLPCAIKLVDDRRALCVLNGVKDIPSPGQLAVFYDNDTVAAGGIIERNTEHLFTQ